MEIVHRNRAFKVVRASRRANGRSHDVFIVDKPSEVGIIPLIDEETVLMERQYRRAVRKTLYEIPLGHIEQGEKPETAARRELEEETGYKAGRLRYLGKVYSSPGFLTSVSYLYVATGLTKGKVHLDDDEVIKVMRIRLDRLERMIRTNEITCAKTIDALLYYMHFCRRQSD